MSMLDWNDARIPMDWEANGRSMADALPNSKLCFDVVHVERYLFHLPNDGLDVVPRWFIFDGSIRPFQCFLSYERNGFFVLLKKRFIKLDEDGKERLSLIIANCQCANG